MVVYSSTPYTSAKTDWSGLDWTLDPLHSSSLGIEWSGVTLGSTPLHPWTTLIIADGLNLLGSETVYMLQRLDAEVSICIPVLQHVYGLLDVGI